MNRNARFFVPFLGAILLYVLVFGLAETFENPTDHVASVRSNHSTPLRLPAFSKPAIAEDESQEDFEFDIDSAGVTAYAKVNEELDLDVLEPRFKSIRRRNDEQITGIVIVPGYEDLPEFGESSEVQVFLHRDGWIVAYLTRWQTSAELFDWIRYDEDRLNETRIGQVVKSLASDLGETDIVVNYFDFRNPHATQLMLVADAADSIVASDDFTVNVPTNLELYEGMWSVAHTGNTAKATIDGWCTLDEEALAELTGTSGGVTWRVETGNLNKDDFRQGRDHTFSVRTFTKTYCGIVMVYGEESR